MMNDNRKIIPFNQNGEFHFNQGVKKSGQNNKHDALRSFQKAIELEGNNLAYLSQYAYLLAEVGRGAEAEHILINEFIQHQYDAEFYFILSQLYIIMNDPNKAFLFGVQYMKHEPDSGYDEELENMFEVSIDDEDEVEKEADRFTGQHLFQHLFMNARIDEALEFLSSIPVEIQEEREFRNLKAMASLFLNRYEEAHTLLEQLLKEDQTDMHALSHMTLLYYHTGEQEKYSAFLKKMEVVQPLDDDARFKVGLVLNFLKKYERSYELLFPLYKKQAFVSFQLLHALSHSSYHMGNREEAEMFWEKMQTFHPVDEAFTPWKKHEAAERITQLELEYLKDDDVYKRLLGIYKIYNVEPRDAILGHEVWETIESLEDYEKLYISFLFQGLKLVRLGRMHKGLEALRGAGFVNEVDQLAWIETFHDLYDRKEDVEDTHALAAATMHFHKRDRKITKKSLVEQFNTSIYRLNKAIEKIKHI
ncbi:tetratricopeptide repeat protein [Salinicoccus sp. HZC-1]|uniref:tetratricopeptide repeat protein n=1 Tax=Salinicoccus sp. HZC-1 TaxID=3385497 RepID=UPI00398B6B21